MSTSKRLFLLGSVRIRQGEQVTDRWRSHRAVALLAYLVCQDHPVPRSELVELIWPDKPEERGRANLRWALSYLGKLLPGCWQVTRRTAQFQAGEACWVDVLALQQALAADDVTELETAVTAAQGEFCRGFYFDESPEFETWLLTQREQWRQQLITAWQRLIAHHSGQGQYSRTLVFARQMLAQDTWQESAHRQVMELLARSGDFNGALAQYETCRRLLAEALDVEPMPPTEKLYRRIRVARVSTRHNLPSQPTRFIGRQRELAWLRQWLADPETRLVTITGTGGTGKTRLGLQAAQENLPHFLNGAAFLSLAEVTSPENLPQAIVNMLAAAGIVLPLPPRQSALPYLLGQLQQRELLCILDNYEHLLPDTALIMQIIEETADVKLLVTSRERLNLRWERLLPLAGLPYSEQEDWDTSDAVRLFTQTARRAQPDFTPATDNRQSVTTICRLVEGMPLALELAASWIGTQPLAELAVELQSGLDLLVGTEQDRAPRQRSVRVTFDYSWQRLTEPEQAVLRQLSVFHNGFYAEAAQQVTQASATILDSLLAKSLIRRSGDRYEMHPLLRQFAAEKLTAAQEESAAQQRHADYFLVWLGQQAAPLISAAQPDHLRQIGEEYDNVMAAWVWACDQRQIDLLYQAAPALSRYVRLQNDVVQGERLFGMAVQAAAQHEQNGRWAYLAAEWVPLLGRIGQKQRAVDLAEAALAAARQTAQPQIVAACLDELAQMYAETRRGEEAVALLKEAIGLWRERDMPYQLGLSLRYLGNRLHSLADLAASERVQQESLAIFQRLRDPHNTIIAMINLGGVAYSNGHLEEAKEMFEELLTMPATRRAPFLRMHSLSSLGSIHLDLGAPTAAYESLQEAFSIATQLGHQDQMLWTQRRLSAVEMERGNLSAARRHLRQVLQKAHDIDFTSFVLNTLVTYAEVLQASQQFPAAFKLAVFARERHDELDIARRPDAERLVTELTAQLPPEQIAALSQEAKEMTLETAVSLALQEAA